MKNTINEFWFMLCSDDEELQEEGQLQRLRFFQQYPRYFDETVEALPKKFAEIYRKINFHDFQILDIYLNERSYKESEITLYIYDFHEDYSKDTIYKIVYSGVISHIIAIKNAKHRLTWAYDIFENCKNDLWIHRIMCNDSNNLEIVFKNISIKQLKKEKL